MIVSEFVRGRRMDNREKILEATIRVFNRKGLKLTMDDIASELSMSKKTIYTVFKDKESLFGEMVDYCFDKIKESEIKIICDKNMTTMEKIRAVLGVLPEGYREIDYSKLYCLKSKYPKIYNKVEYRLQSGWESTINLIKQGISEGVIRPININIFKTMMESTIGQFFQRDVLIQNNISYVEALEEVVNILVDGIVV